ncbi:hypothetical protein [Rhizobium sp. RAF56]|uniref:hypothetical protein n=1 Tax=Rhizobium sp. RAF56 TaxID=3233062 RepID=UPI003F97EF8C
MILSPMLPQPYIDRQIDCEMAIAMDVHILIDLAVKAGWKRKEAIAAVASVMLNVMAVETENEETSFSVATALGKVLH